MQEKLRHVIEAQQFTREWIENWLFPLAGEMERLARWGEAKTLMGKRMITFFYEPSTRTRASFEIAMNLLGGDVVFSTENAEKFSSAAKDESLRDTVRVLNRYHPNVIVMRFKNDGEAAIAASVSAAPVINAGDGSGQHPTQALLDLYTIYKRFGRIDGLSIAVVGDLLHGRTVRSLSYLLGKFSDVRIYFISPGSLSIRDDIKGYLVRHGVLFTETENLRWAVPNVDVIYQTRIQKERGSVLAPEDAARFHISGELVSIMKQDSIIMHPLPRNEEIALEVDNDPRAVYLTDQVSAGLYVRMALLTMILA